MTGHQFPVGGGYALEPARVQLDDGTTLPDTEHWDLVNTDGVTVVQLPTVDPYERNFLLQPDAVRKFVQWVVEANVDLLDPAVRASEAVVSFTTAPNHWER